MKRYQSKRYQTPRFPDLEEQSISRVYLPMLTRHLAWAESLRMHGMRSLQIQLLVSGYILAEPDSN